MIGDDSGDLLRCEFLPPPPALSSPEEALDAGRLFAKATSSFLRRQIIERAMLYRFGCACLLSGQLEKVSRTTKNLGGLIEHIFVTDDVAIKHWRINPTQHMR
ncbi:MAG: hypothetical protein M0P19_01325 [Nevskia sp.]|nr:hypothetical protein [Nevskia sp.]